MKYLFNSFLITILCTCNLFAQKYHDEAALGLKGHVKEVVIVSGGPDPYGFYNKCTFNRNGALTYYEFSNFSDMKKVSRSSRGYLQCFTKNETFFGVQSESHMLYFYDKNNRVERIDEDFSSDNFYYNSKGCLYKSKDLQGIVLYYDIKEIDNNGNYLTIDIYRDDNGKHTYLRTTKRSITYWDNNVTTSNKKNSFSTNTSTYSSVKAVFHGTRVGKVYHLPEDSRDDYDLFFQCNVSVYGIKGEKVTLTVYVDGPTRGKGLYAPNGRHKTSEGNVAIGESVNGRTDSDDTRWPHYTLTLPFSDLCLPDGTHTINVRWFAQAGGKFIGNSEFQTVHFTKHGKKITNFYVDRGEATSGFYE